MTNGPEAEVGDVLVIPFARPRDRKVVMEHPDYYRLREHLIDFLENRSHLRQPKTVGKEPPSPEAEKAEAAVREGNQPVPPAQTSAEAVVI